MDEARRVSAGPHHALMTGDPPWARISGDAGRPSRHPRGERARSRVSYSPRRRASPSAAPRPLGPVAQARVETLHQAGRALVADRPVLATTVEQPPPVCARQPHHLVADGQTVDTGLAGRERHELAPRLARPVVHRQPASWSLSDENAGCRPEHACVAVHTSKVRPGAAGRGRRLPPCKAWHPARPMQPPRPRGQPRGARSSMPTTAPVPSGFDVPTQAR